MLTWKHLPRFLLIVGVLLALDGAVDVFARGRPFALAAFLEFYLFVVVLFGATVAVLLLIERAMTQVPKSWRFWVRLGLAVPLVGLAWVGAFWLFQWVK